MVRRGALALLATVAQAGPLILAQPGDLLKSPVVYDCDYCSLVTSYESLPDPPQTVEFWSIVGFLALLATVGCIGVRVRVRTKR